LFKNKKYDGLSLRETVIVSSPLAIVYHPLWKNIFSQAFGWAKGDVLCLSSLPHSTFYSLPNWIEWIGFYSFWIFYSFFYPRVSMTQNDTAEILVMKILFVILSIFLLECVFNFLTTFPNVSKYCKDGTVVKQFLIGVLAIVPAMLQDTVRFSVKVLNVQWYQLCCHFDWMDGQKDHVVSMRFSLLIRNVVFLLTVVFWHMDGSFSLLPIAVVAVIIVVWSRAQFWNEDVYRQDYLQSIPPLLPEHLQTTKPCSTATFLTKTSCNSSGDKTVSHDVQPTTLLGNPFVVLAYQRTGSNYLCGRLHNHNYNQILMHSEVFNEEKVYYYLPKELSLSEMWKEKWNIFTRNANPFQFIIDIFTTVPYTRASSNSVLTL
jgi:hypothetical protein